MTDAAADTAADSLIDTPERPAPGPVTLTPEQAKYVRRELWLTVANVSRKLSAYVPQDHDKLALALRRLFDALEAMGGMDARS